MNAIRQIVRCAKHQTEEARHPTVEDLKPAYSVEHAVNDTEHIPQDEPIGNGEVV